MELLLKVFSLLCRMESLFEQINSLLRFFFFFLLISKHSSLDGYHYNKESIEIQKAAFEKKGDIVLLVSRNMKVNSTLLLFIRNETWFFTFSKATFLLLESEQFQRKNQCHVLDKI